MPDSQRYFEVPGSQFTICLPRLIEPTNPMSPQRPAQCLQQTIRRLRILLVNDNADAAAVLSMLLEASGHVVFVEHASKPALERARLEKPDLCLLDIGLPEIDGNELAQYLRCQPETAKFVLIAVTGYGQEHDRKKTRLAGFDHHFVKPVDTKKLNTVLAQIALRLNHDPVSWCFPPGFLRIGSSRR